MIITVAYTGMRWSEVIGLGPECLQDDHMDVSWKLYELNGRFYRGRPKDGSIRLADLPPFLVAMLANHVSGRTTGAPGSAPAGIPTNLGARAVATSSSAPSRATSIGPTTVNGSSGPPPTAPTQPARSGQRCRSSSTSRPRTRDDRYHHGRWPCLARNSSHQPAGASPAWSATPRPAGARCVVGRGRGDWTGTSFRMALSALAARDRDNRLQTT
jgi:hypothetical protein